MLVITGVLRFREADLDFVRREIVEVTRLSRADDGCIDYWWASEIEDPGAFRFFECWESEAHFEAHQAQPFERAFHTDVVSRITGATAHRYVVSERGPAVG